MSALKIVVIPRDPSPYQELLHEPLRARGVSVHYASEITPSRTLNLLLLPFELASLRVAGYNIFHLHWTFGFRFTGSDRSRAVRRASRLWFGFVLWMARHVGFRVVWTAHNVLPHAPVFDDDIRARRTLVKAASLVIAHSNQTLAGLASLGAEARTSEVIPHGPISAPGLRRLAPRAPTGRRTVLFFGRVEPYKGVEELLHAVDGMNGSLKVVVAGRCSDPRLRERLITAAGRVNADVELFLDHVPEHDVVRFFAAADALVFPFRSVTTSGSVMLGLASGRPAVLPDLAAFEDLPEAAVIRYAPGTEGLREVLTRVTTMPAEALAAKASAAARVAGESVGWEEIADRTVQALRAVLSPTKLPAQEGTP